MKRLLVAIVVAGGFVTGCNKIDQVCTSEKPASALVFDFPDSVEAGTSKTIEIQYVLDNDCGSFDELEVVNDQYTFEIKVKTKYEGCNCDPQFVEGKVDFTMQMDYPGIYEFKFWLADEDYDTYSLKVY